MKPVALEFEASTGAHTTPSGVGSSTGRMTQAGGGQVDQGVPDREKREEVAQGGPEREEREEDSEAGAPPRRVRDTAWDNATQEQWGEYMEGAL